ncbi:extracellular solute-binding protein [Ketobacter sp.]
MTRNPLHHHVKPMLSIIACNLLNGLSIAFILVFGSGVHADVLKATSLSLYDAPKYNQGFTHFDYANPQAPKGGRITLPGLGTFDTLNPYVLKGISASEYTAVYGITEMNEPIMAGTNYYLESGDESQTAYCLICEWLEYPTDYAWVIFQLNAAARFHNGDPITANDVAASFELVTGNQAHPALTNNFSSIEKVEVLSDHRVKIYFKGPPERSNLFRAGEIPVMSHQHWKKHRFGESSGTPQPLSGPYRVKDFVLGNYLVLERVDDFWSKDSPVYKGMFNFDQVRYEFYRDRTVAFEAFKSGSLDFWIEYISKNWATGYDFPAVKQGRVIKQARPHNIPSNTQAFFLNMRRPVFQDLNVRKAVSLMFDFNWINRNIFANAYKRSQSHFPNSEMGSQGKPSADEVALLEPFRAQLPPELFTEEFHFQSYQSPKEVRVAMREAIKLLKAAGWEYHDKKLINSKTRKPLEFEIMIENRSFQRVLLPLIKNLQKIGITARTRIVDSAQYKVRLDDYDYDMIVYVLPQTASPGFEQQLYFHSDQVGIRGAKNLSGISDPAVDAMIARIKSATSTKALTTAVRALDRILLWNYYTIPQYYLDYHRIAYKDIFVKPEHPPSLNLGFQTWWVKTKAR